MSEIGAGEALNRKPRGQILFVSPAPEPADGTAATALPNGQTPSAAPSVGELCGQLMGLQRQRVFAIRMQGRCDRAVEAFIRTQLGYRTDMPEGERKKVSAEAKRTKKAVEQGEGRKGTADIGLRPDVLSTCSAVVLQTAASREGWDAMVGASEKHMRSLAQDLPGWPFCAQVKGISDLGLAVIVGEAGDLSGYPKHGHLWKRLGLAVIDGKRQGAPGTSASAEDWTRHGYKPARRAEVWAFLDDVMFRAQWRGEKDGEPAHPIGPYGEKYARKKAEYLARDDIAAPDRAARRYMTKCFIRDLWNAWRQAKAALP